MTVTTKSWLVYGMLLGLLYSQWCLAIVIRHDQEPASYAVTETPDFFVDMPHEGHGVLIAPQWVVTAAHTIFYNYTQKSWEIDGETYTIINVVKHPQYRDLPEDKANRSDENLWLFLLDRADIALVQVDRTITGKTPINIYRGEEEVGLEVTIFGRGATGDGLRGADSGTKEDRVLRRCANIIDTANRQWLSYQFDAPATAIAQEGMHGSGDSGGPAVAHIDGVSYLLGLSIWELRENDDEDYIAGLYGTTAYLSRLSYFAGWIDDVIKNAARESKR